MTGKKNKKAEKRLKERYGTLAASMSTYYEHLDFRPFDDFDDAAFAFLMEKVRGVNMLDLNETSVTNASIALLPRLEYLHELRAKGCKGLDDGCLEYLGRIPGLRFMHLKYTGITLEGLLTLTGLPDLRELMFSAEESPQLAAKMGQLRAQLPGCRFVVNGRPWEFDEDEGGAWALRNR